MAAYDTTTTAAALKEHYSKGEVKNVVYPNNPFFAMVERERTGGKYHDFAIEYELPASRSHTITTALANKKASKFAEFNVTLIKDYIAISLDRFAMKVTEKSEDAYFDTLTRGIDSALKSLVRSAAQGMYRGIGGVRARVSTATAPSGTTLTLNDADESANLAVGDVLVASPNDGSSAAHTLRVGSNTITAIDEDAGTITGSAAWTTAITGLTTSDYLFKDGDFRLSWAGLESWCPATAPTAGDSFYGQDRSAHPTRLAGSRVTTTGDTMSEAILKCSEKLGKRGGMPDTCLMSHAKFRDLCMELGTKMTYESRDASDAKVGFEGVVFLTNSGKVTCFADHNCPNAKIYVLNKDAVRMVYASEDVPEIQENDTGSILFPETGSDGYEVRGSYYANLIAVSPNEICVGSF